MDAVSEMNALYCSSVTPMRDRYSFNISLSFHSLLSFPERILFAVSIANCFFTGGSWKRSIKNTTVGVPVAPNVFVPNNAIAFR